MKLFAILVLTISASTMAQVQWNGFARHQTAVRPLEQGDWSMVQNALSLNLENRSDNKAFKADFFISHNIGDSALDWRLRQLYMDLSFDAFDFRIGKQQVIWGKADGVFITDVVSPKDLSEFLLPDFAEIRQGVTALTSNAFVGNHTFSLVLVPIFTPTITPDTGSIWRVAPPAPAGVRVSMDASQQDVALKAVNSEVFGRWSAILESVDFEMMAGWMWDDDPSLHISKRFAHINSTNGQMVLDSLVVSPQHHRLAVGGGSMSSTLAGFVLKGEGALYLDKRFQSTDPAATEGLVSGNYLHSMLGASYAIGGVDFGLQFIQKYLIDHDSYYHDKEFQNMITAMIRKSLLRETLHLELFSYVGLDDQDALVRPSVGYDISDGLRMTLGANLFYGDSGSFGQYDKNDMLYGKLAYYF